MKKKALETNAGAVDPHVRHIGIKDLAWPSSSRGNEQVAATVRSQWHRFPLKPLVLGVVAALFSPLAFAAPPSCSATDIISANTGLYTVTSANCITINNGITVDSVENLFPPFSVPILTNNGTITNLLHSHGTISLLVNNGSVGTVVHGDFVEIDNFGTIGGLLGLDTLGLLINAQGGSSPLAITGNLPTNYQIYVRSTSDYGKLSATFQSGAMTFGIAGGSTLASHTYASVLAGIQSANLAGALSGTFGAFNWTLSDGSILNDGIWDLIVTGGASSAGFVPLSTAISRGAATVLDSAPAGLSAPIATLSALSQAEQTVALKRITPETSRAAEYASIQTISGALDTVAARLEGIREQGFALGLADDLRQGKLMLAAHGDVGGLMDAGGIKKRGFWMKGFGAHGNQDQRSDFAGYDNNTWGMAFGADTLLESNWIVGAALTYARTDVNMDDYRSGDDINIKTYQATAYASRDFGKWYAEGMLAYAKQKFDSSRDTTVSGVAKADYDGYNVAARVNAGWPFALSEQTTLTPTVGLEVSRFKQDGYTEHGAGALSLNVEDESATRVRSVLGAKLATERPMQNGLTFMPSVHVGWRHDFREDGIDSTSAFTGGGATFKTPGQDIAKNSFNIGAALAFKKANDFALTLRLDGEKGSGYSSVAGQVVGQWLF